jgi:hypothetical protein
MAELRKSVLGELGKLKNELLKCGSRGEAADCDAISAKVLNPQKPITENGGIAVYPGPKNYARVLALWSEAGTLLGGLFKEAQPNLKDKELEEAKLFEGWFLTFPDLAQGISHLNRRRRACKLGPVTEDWAGSIGGYLHGIYLKRNKDQPSVKGLGAHNEDRKLPGWTPEGEKAAGGILAWGSSAPGMMDMWLNSRFHRDPVLNKECTHVAFGGRPDGGYSCRSTGSGGRAETDLVTWPGDEDTEIPTSFGNELPNPFPLGVTSSGTVVVIDFVGRQYKKPEWKLLDPGKEPVETLTLDAKNPYCFVAKSPLRPGTKYTVEVASPDGFRHTFSFTTSFTTR